MRSNTKKICYCFLKNVLNEISTTLERENWKRSIYVFVNNWFKESHTCELSNMSSINLIDLDSSSSLNI